MPKIVSRQPHWLNRGFPAYDLFHSSLASRSHQPAASWEGPSRRIAHRGTEVFVAVGNELRWADLATLQDNANNESTAHGLDFSTGQKPRQASGYKLLKAPVARPIQQLSVSPSGEYLAILTSHTCHVCLIPASDTLNFQDATPIKMTSFQIGPTAHVLEQSPLVSVKWHPLSATGNGLVTVTLDACVRLWELDSSNRGTFNEPALAFDLKKLGNATTAREDLTASRYGVKKGFSPDEVEMEVAASCFGGFGADDEDGWSSMTLWVAMAGGDVYALCPFLPSTFWTPSTVLPTLTTSVVAKCQIVEADKHASGSERRVAAQQMSWLGEIDDQEPIATPGMSALWEVYTRPQKTSAIPRLQGPFRQTPEPEFGEVTDIHVIAPKIDDGALFDDEEYEQFTDDEGLSVGVICLATNTGRIHVCLNVQGVEAEWLPSGRDRDRYSGESDEEHELLLLETIDFNVAKRSIAGKTTTGDWWPTFTSSPLDRYEFFTTQPTGVFSISLRPAVMPIENELSRIAPGTEGVSLRAQIILGSTKSLVEPITSETSDPIAGLNAAIAILDDVKSDMGYLVLTSTPNAIFAAVLDLQSPPAHPHQPDVGQGETFTGPDPRAPYQPAQEFFQESSLLRQAAVWRQQTAPANQFSRGLSLDDFTLRTLTDAHGVVSSETHFLNTAAGDLFRRCERLVLEMKGQVEKARELRDRMDRIVGDEQGSNLENGVSKIQSRIKASTEKTAEIRQHVETLRRKTRTLGGKELSAKEQAFAAEVSRLEKSLAEPPAEPLSTAEQRAQLVNSDLSASTDSEPSSTSDDNSIAMRFTAVQALFSTLLKEAEDVQPKPQSTSSIHETRQAKSAQPDRPRTYKQRQFDRMWDMLDREQALVDAVSVRVERLRLDAQRADEC